MFWKETLGRDGKWNDKKIAYAIACLVASYILVFIAWKDNMEDWAFICLYCAYLVTVGGFEIILKMMAMIIEFKNGKPSMTTTTIQEVKTG
jgi:hypothetical protein